LIAIKKLLFLCGLKQTTYRRSTIFIYVTKTTDFWGNIFTLVEGTGPATMLMKITFKKDVTPSIPWSGQFIEHTGDNLLPICLDRGNIWYGCITEQVLLIACSLMERSLTYQLPWQMLDPLTGGVGYGELANSFQNSLLRFSATLRSSLGCS
jgi:hypothetical protein